MIVILIILGGLVILRLLLPHVALYFINRTLARIKGFQGHIDTINVNLLRGHYIIHNIVLNKADSNTHAGEPFFTASKVDVLVQWRALFRKSIVATIVAEQPEMNLTKETSEPQDETKSPPGLKTLLQNVLPFNITLGIKGGTIYYTDTTSKAKVDLTLTDLTLCIRDLSNMPAREAVPARINASTNVYEGTLDLTMKLYPMREHLTFDLNTEVKNINMVLLNSFFRAYAKIDVNRGTFDMYTEVAAKDGGFTGYVKPVIRDMDIVGVEDRNDGLFRKLWERFVAGVYQVIKNKKEDQLAAKIPIEGRLDNPHINIFVALATIFQNAFIRALHPSVDDVINIASVRESISNVKEFVKGVFNRKEKV